MQQEARLGYCRWMTTQAAKTEADQCYSDPTILTFDENGHPKNPKDLKVYLNRPGFRLPTESEWEAICRNHTESAYSFGNDPQLLRDYGWYEQTSNGWSHSVSKLRPGPRGLFDTHGNMFEWCNDQYQSYGSQSRLSSIFVDPLGTSNDSRRLIRGGSWYDNDEHCRSALRGKELSSSRLNYFGMGIRLVFNLSNP